jgi:hypothetical protein
MLFVCSNNIIEWHFDKNKTIKKNDLLEMLDILRAFKFSSPSKILLKTDSNLISPNVLFLVKSNKYQRLVHSETIVVNNTFKLIFIILAARIIGYWRLGAFYSSTKRAKSRLKRA